MLAGVMLPPFREMRASAWHGTIGDQACRQPQSRGHREVLRLQQIDCKHYKVVDCMSSHVKRRLVLNPYLPVSAGAWFSGQGRMMRAQSACKEVVISILGTAWKLFLVHNTHKVPPTRVMSALHNVRSPHRKINAPCGPHA